MVLRGNEELLFSGYKVSGVLDENFQRHTVPHCAYREQ